MMMAASPTALRWLWLFFVSVGSVMALPATSAFGAGLSSSLQPRFFNMPLNTCINPMEGKPEHIWYGVTDWKYPYDDNCEVDKNIDRQTGECFNNLNLENECNAFCQMSTGVSETSST